MDDIGKSKIYYYQSVKQRTNLDKISPDGVLNFSFLSPNKFFAKFLAQPMPNPKHNE